MPRKITDLYEVLGLNRGAKEVDVRAAYLRLAKKHHPDKNPEDKASEWIFKEVQRAYETLRDANDGLPAGQERPPRAQEDEHAWTAARAPAGAATGPERTQANLPLQKCGLLVDKAASNRPSDRGMGEVGAGRGDWNVWFGPFHDSWCVGDGVVVESIGVADAG